MSQFTLASARGGVVSTQQRLGVLLFTLSACLLPAVAAPALAVPATTAPAAGITVPGDPHAAILRKALTDAELPVAQLPMTALAPTPTQSPPQSPAQSTPVPATALQGTLELVALPGRSAFRVLRDQFNYLDDNATVAARRTLPTIRLHLLEQQGEIIPVPRGIVQTDNPAWDYLFEPGAIWTDASAPTLRQIALPFALMERNANCLHNGILRFQLDAEDRPSAAYFQISSETCAYLQFDLHGIATVHWQAQPVAQAESVRSDRLRERQHRLPTLPLSRMAEHVPQADGQAFSAERDIAVAHRSVAGVVIDGRHYRSDCDTRQGPYPFCDALLLPSYSTAKSIVAGLALMRLQRLYPGIVDAQVQDYVPACRQLTQWQGVSFGHLLDMATGNYDSAAAEADESAAHFGHFVAAERHADKVHYACNQFPRRAAPGTRMVYHSSDTYLLGTAMQAWLKRHIGESTDLYRDGVYQPIFKPLQLSPALATTRRSLDEQQQPFTSFGLTLLPDDVAKLLQFLGPARGQLPAAAAGDTAVFDELMLAEALQQRSGQRSLSAGLPGVRYENGFWAVDVAPMLGCRQSLYVPTLSGYGGISWVLFPNGIGYYYFSDGGEFRWRHAAVAAHRIRSLCK